MTETCSNLTTTAAAADIVVNGRHAEPKCLNCTCGSTLLGLTIQGINFQLYQNHIRITPRKRSNNLGIVYLLL